VAVHPASIEDRDGVALVLNRLTPVVCSLSSTASTVTAVMKGRKPPRLGTDIERSARMTADFIRVAMIRIMLRRFVVSSWS
jgi:hypothetical protein